MKFNLHVKKSKSFLFKPSLACLFIFLFILCLSTISYVKQSKIGLNIYHNMWWRYGVAFWGGVMVWWRFDCILVKTIPRQPLRAVG